MDLQLKTALPITLNDDGTLSFNEPLTSVVPNHRTFQDLRPYLADPEANFSGGNIVYDMYRGICLPKDRENLKGANLRFDITVFYPGMLGQEFCKTAGHYHPFAPGTKVRYPETYEVVLGQALFLMQKVDEAFERVLDVYAMEVNEGEDVIFLPGYAHFLINPTNKILITSNWSADNFKSLYEPVAKSRGAAYYVIKNTNGNSDFVANRNYTNIPTLKFLKPKELPHFGLIKSQPAYTAGQNSPDMLQFLNQPELYLDQLTIDQCYLRI